ncbi:MAG: T9SS C-terminal target domain-containing protein [Bacteroidia bacterium]|nr:MAG: T9SS C-terminal target domain-containing protein [Bacteroidia bacterium]
MNHVQKAILFVILALSIAPLQSGEPVSAFEMNQRLGRGINMGNAFEAPDETAWGNPWKPEYFMIMADLGFSHVRIPVRWSTPERSMEEPPYTIYESFLNRIQEVVDTALKYQLHPIINMHHHNDLFQDPLGQKDRFMAQWSQIAEFFQHYPDSLVFEVLNEPHDNFTPELWNEFFSEALDTIRTTNPSRTVLLGTALYGGLSGVPYLEVPDDPHLILSVHYYNPFQFTHQGASWVGGDSDAWLGTKWFNTEEERQTIINEFSFTKQFAAEHNLPVHVGEFGAYSTADMASRVRWTNFLARWFEEQDFSWAYWEFSAGFGIYNPNNGQFYTSLVDALLHNPMPDPAEVMYIPVLEEHFDQGTSGWQLNTFENAEASMSGGQGNIVIDISSPGTEGWHIQLSKQGIPLQEKELYKVTFSASAMESPRHITTYMGRSSDPWTSYSGYIPVYIETEEKEHIYTFYMNNDTDNNARLVFDLGLSDTNLTFSSVLIEQLSLTTTSAEDHSIPVIDYFPNPVHNKLTIVNTEAFHTLQVFDLMGRNRLIDQINQPLHQLDISDLSPGGYIVHLISNEMRHAFKIIKK